MSTLRFALACLLAILPSRGQRALGTRLLGWDVHPTAHLGHSIILADDVTLGARSSIGNNNMIKGLSELRLDEKASIGSMNWISGPGKSTTAFRYSPNRYPALIMKRASAVTSRHIIDTSDTVTFEEFATLSGIRSTIFTHSVNLVRSQQRTGKVTIGERSAVLTNSLVLSGTVVPARSIVSAGSVVNTVLTKENVFYRGNPAVEVRELPPDLAFFHRTSPKTDWPYWPDPEPT